MKSRATVENSSRARCPEMLFPRKSNMLATESRREESPEMETEEVHWGNYRKPRGG